MIGLCYMARETLDTPCSAHDMAASIQGVQLLRMGLSEVCAVMICTCLKAQSALRRNSSASAPGVMPALQRVQLLEVRCEVGAPVVLVDAGKHLSIRLAHYLEARYRVRPLQCARAASASPVGAVRGRMIADTSGFPPPCTSCFAVLMLDSHASLAWGSYLVKKHLPSWWGRLAEVLLCSPLLAAAGAPNRCTCFCS